MLIAVVTAGAQLDALESQLGTLKSRLSERDAPAACQGKIEEREDLLGALRRRLIAHFDGLLALHCVQSRVFGSEGSMGEATQQWRDSSEARPEEPCIRSG